MNILITGATGNVGASVIRHLLPESDGHTVYAGVRSVERAQTLFDRYDNLTFRVFDFEVLSTFESALKGIDLLFLLRPPHISDVKRYFVPLITEARTQGVKGIVFLSVQGVEKSRVIPHNKIEALIGESGIPAVMLRPSYFMQNLTTTLIDDIRKSGSVVVPAGRALFNWVDVEDIGRVGARVINHFEQHQPKIYEITGRENLDFSSAVSIVNKELGTQLVFHDINPIAFFFRKLRSGMAPGMIMVVILIHFLQRFQGVPAIRETVKDLIGMEPIDLAAFARRERSLLNKKTS